jgi:hypothetical protein
MSLSPQPQHGCESGALRAFCDFVVVSGFAGMFCFAEVGSVESLLPGLLARPKTPTAALISNLREKRTLSSSTLRSTELAPHSYSGIADAAETYSYLAPTVTQTLCMRQSSFGRATHVLETLEELVGSVANNTQTQQALYAVLAEGPHVLYSGALPRGSP